ncbi:MAG: glycine cleavage system aminomethyltransferase GcvT [Actinobacteria bacterium]|nr:glycine cleavage system aminomethyltransferase GcvT [Actinomycetota bacterium]
MASPLRKSPLHDAHLQAGADLVGFAGWEMPIAYAGIRSEHEAVRGAVGIFDVSHMGEIETAGPQAEAFLQRILSNDVTKIAEHGAQYSVLCREDGGVLDDLFTYRLGEDRFLTVTNAANHAKDLAWFRSHARRFEVEVHDRLDEWAMIAVQGPDARETLAALADAALPGRFRTAEIGVAGVECLVCGTGYTGEDGCELLVPAPAAPTVWAALLDAGAVPAGLGARDTLRLEVCFHLYGNDLSEDRDPVEAGLSWCLAPATDFIGSGAIAGRERSQVLVPFAFTEPGIPRPGNEIRTASGSGVVTSGTHSPSLGIGIGMGYVPAEQAEPGSPIEVDVRGRIRAAEVRKKPLYAKEPVA